MRVASLLRGKEGTLVRLRLLRPDISKSTQIIDVTLQRRVFNLG